MGSEFAEVAVNLGRTLLEGRVRIIQAVMAKSRALGYITSAELFVDSGFTQV